MSPSPDPPRSIPGRRAAPAGHRRSRRSARLAPSSEASPSDPLGGDDLAARALARRRTARGARRPSPASSRSRQHRPRRVRHVDDVRRRPSVSFQTSQESIVPKARSSPRPLRSLAGSTRASSPRSTDRAEPCPLADQVAWQLPAALGGAPVLPDDRPLQRSPGATIPDDRRLALIRDPDRPRARTPRARALRERVTGGGQHALPDLLGIVLDPSGLREVLTDLAVAATDRSQARRRRRGTSSPWSPGRSPAASHGACTRRRRRAALGCLPRCASGPSLSTSTGRSPTTSRSSTPCTATCSPNADARCRPRPTTERSPDLSEEVIIRTWLEVEDEALAALVEERIERYLSRSPKHGETVSPTVREAVTYAAERVPVAVVSGAFRREIEPVLAGRRASTVGSQSSSQPTTSQRGKPDPRGLSARHLAASTAPCMPTRSSPSRTRRRASRRRRRPDSTASPCWVRIRAEAPPSRRRDRGDDRCRSRPARARDDHSSIAHRGACWDLPENTLPAFERAIESVPTTSSSTCTRLTDGSLVVCHDRPRGGEPRLEQAVDAPPRQDRNHVRAEEPLALPAPRRRPSNGRAAAGGCNRRVVRRRARSRPVEAGAFSSTSASASSIRRAARYAWGVGFHDLDSRRRGLAKARALGLVTTVYTVNDPCPHVASSRARRRRVFTDRPDLLREVLRSSARLSSCALAAGKLSRTRAPTGRALARSLERSALHSTAPIVTCSSGHRAQERVRETSPVSPCRRRRLRAPLSRAHEQQDALSAPSAARRFDGNARPGRRRARPDRDRLTVAWIRFIVPTNSATNGVPALRRSRRASRSARCDPATGPRRDPRSTAPPPDRASRRSW